MAAPHLDEYFRVQSELLGVFADQSADPLERMRTMMDPTKMEARRDENAKRLEQLREISAKSFDHHDTKKDGVLHAEESQVFFTHFVERFVPFMTDVASQSLTAVINKKKEEMKLFVSDEAQQKEIEVQLADMVKQAQQQIIATFKERGEAYTSDRAAKDAAAFAVLDKNGDGKLTKAMVVEGLTPKTDLHYALMVALGMSTVEEVEGEKQSEANREAMTRGAQLGRA